MPPGYGPGTPPPGDRPSPARRTSPSTPRPQNRAEPARDAHVEAFADGQWRQGLLIEQQQDHLGAWRFHVAFLLPDQGGTSLVAEWLTPSHVRRRPQS